MKITIVQGAFLPVPAIMGGAVEKVWFALGKAFAQRGHQVTHISRQHRDLPVIETLDGVRCLRVPGFDAPKSLFRLKMLDLIYSVRVLRHLPPADILVTNTFFLPILARDRTRGKIYVHVARYPKGQMRFYRRVARLQTVSRPIAEAIEREAPELASRIQVIPYPTLKTAHSHLTPEGDQPRARQILFVGRIHPEKGVHLLIQAFASLPLEKRQDWRLAIVGPTEIRLGGGGEKYRQHLKQLAGPIADRVDWHGPVFDPERLATVFRASPIFVYPSLAERGETFGLAPLEAMSHGCVPLVSELPCFHDFIEDQREGVFFNHAAERPERELSNRILELMTDEDQCRRIGRSARSKAEEFGLGRVTTLFLEDFHSILA